MHEFFADFAELALNGGGEHHHLLAMGSLDEDLLDLATHV